MQDRLSTSSALFPEHAAIPGSQSKDFALRLICDADLLDNSLRRIVRSDDQVQFLSAGHTLDADRRELAPRRQADCRRAASVRFARPPRADRDRIVRKDDRLASARGGRVVATLASRVNAAHPMP
jgi:hypothetical protein